MPRKPAPRFLSYLWSLALVGLMSVLGELVARSFEPTNLVMLYLLAVVISAALWGRGPAITTAVVSVLVFDFLFIPPRFTFTVDQTQYILTFIGLFVVGVVISELAVKMRQRAIEARKREAQTSALYNLNKDLASCRDLDETLSLGLSHMRNLIGSEVRLYTKTEGSFRLWKAHARDRAEVGVFLKKTAGTGIGESPRRQVPGIFLEAGIVFLPLLAGSDVLGFFAYGAPAEGGELTSQIKKFQEAMANQVALAVERMRLLEENRQIEVLHEAEKLHAALFSSISHDLRTPLVSITGAMSSLMREGTAPAPALQKELIETAYEESVRLNRLVSRLLDMARIEAGALQVRINPCELKDVVAVSLEDLDEKSKRRDIRVDIPEDLVDIPVDFQLMTKVLGNLVENAAKFSYPESTILISARVEDDHLHIRVRNQGEGIPREDLERVFGKFYRAEGTQKIQGTGLGLSICKGIVELHRGRIWVESEPKRETVAHVELPLRRDNG
jgi:two-component system sensor histidine kinase KdpD